MARASEATGLSILLLLLLGTIAIGQQYQPAIEYQSLMNLRYYENNGGFLIEDLQLVFPPTNIGNAKLVVFECQARRFSDFRKTHSTPSRTPDLFLRDSSTRPQAPTRDTKCSKCIG